MSPCDMLRHELEMEGYRLFNRSYRSRIFIKLRATRSLPYPLAETDIGEIVSDEAER